MEWLILGQRSKLLNNPFSLSQVFIVEKSRKVDDEKTKRKIYGG